MKEMASRFPFLLCAAVFFLSCSTPPPAGSPETGYSVWGYVGNSTTAPASNVPVLLVNGETDRPVASKNTNIMGKYAFSGLQPGYYKVKAGDIAMDVVIASENMRLDIDLSAKGGVMNYAAGAMKSIGSTGKAGGDPALVQAMAGKYWGYSGASTLSGGGGTETNMAFCPDGSFYDNTESSYYGSSGDSYGNETMGWGASSQSGAAGTWSIEGTTQSGTITIHYKNGNESVIRYQAGDERGSYYFDGSLTTKTGNCE